MLRFKGEAKTFTSYILVNLITFMQLKFIQVLSSRAEIIKKWSAIILRP
jgi:hypothetical protein